MSSIKCGNCKETHTTVLQVKNCYNAKLAPGELPLIADYVAVEQKLPRQERMSNMELFTPAESGIYKNSAGIFKVYKAMQNDRMLCKILKADAETKTAVFTYMGMAHRFVKLNQKMTLEEAKEFGAIYGVCCMCGRTLTDENSIAAGIGPICASKF